MGKIYKATNRENGKIYIGQTKRNINVRIKQHISDSKKFSHRNFYKDLSVNSDIFDWEIVEDNVSNDIILERELYYINKYNSYNDGYNMLNCVESTAKLSEDDVFDIVDSLKNSKKTFLTISHEFNVSESLIGNINSGLKWSNLLKDIVVYPIRDTKRSVILTLEQVDEIKLLLSTTNMTQKDIGLKFNSIRKRITDINNGKTFYDETIDYPIRKNSVSYSHIESAIKILEDIKNSNMSMKEIAKKYNINLSFLYNFRNGTLDYIQDLGYKFPLRKNEK